MNRETGWEEFLFGPGEPRICEKCVSQLVPVSGEVCEKCGRPFAKLESRFRKGNLCLDCVRWESSPKWKQVLLENRSLYEYNDFLAEVIARFKYRGDYAVAKIFAPDVKRAAGQFDYDYAVPVPLSISRLYERGFNQSECVLIEAGITPVHLLVRLHSEKQAKKSRAERIRLPQVFQLISPALPLRNKRILLFDDVYTTGSTLHHAAYVLKQAGAKAVRSLTLARR